MNAATINPNIYPPDGNEKIDDPPQIEPFVNPKDASPSKIDFIESEDIAFENIEKAIKQDLKLNEIEGISFSEEKVQIQFEVEKFTEKIIELPLIAINVPKGYKLKCYPAKIDIVTTVAFNNYNKLNENLFVAQVDASNIKQNKRLDVILSKQPSFTDIVKIKPSRVEFLLIKKKKKHIVLLLC